MTSCHHLLRRKASYPHPKTEMLNLPNPRTNHQRRMASHSLQRRIILLNKNPLNKASPNHPKKVNPNTLKKASPNSLPGRRFSLNKNPLNMASPNHPKKVNPSNHLGKGSPNSLPSRRFSLNNSPPDRMVLNSSLLRRVSSLPIEKVKSSRLEMMSSPEHDSRLSSCVYLIIEKPNHIYHNLNC